MRPFLTQDGEYERVILRENEFEAFVKIFWDRLAPGWHYFDWKPLLSGPAGDVKPDAVAISPDFADWYVVEVELAAHPSEHFVSQFQRLSEVPYGTQVQASLAQLDSSIDASKWRELVSRPPGFLCVADESTSSLVSACRDYGFEYLVMTPYRSRLGAYATQCGPVPTLFRRSSEATEYWIIVGADSWGGRRWATLPRNFPMTGEIHLRYGGGLRTTKVRAFGDARRILLPPSFNHARGAKGGAKLVAIDPAARVYELV